MADPAKYKSVSLSIETYQILNWLRKGKIIDAELRCTSRNYKEDHFQSNQLRLSNFDATSKVLLP